MLQNKKLQHSVVDVVTESLSHQVGSKVSIDQIEWNFPNSFVLKDVYIEDQQKDTLLFVDRTKVTINLLKLFSSQISFRTIQFTGLNANLSMDSLQTPNFQFFVNAFKSDSKDTLSFQWSMDIESVAFEHCEISYKNPYQEKIIGRLNPNDLDVYDINGCMFVRSFVEDSVYVLLDGLSFKEKSGLVIDNITTTVSADNQKIDVRDFTLNAPNSRLTIDDLLIYHDQYKAFDDPLNKLKIKLYIDNSTIRPSDFSYLHPSLDLLTDNLSIKGGVYGLLSSFQVYDLMIKYGQSTCVSGDAFVQNVFPHVNDVQLDANIDRISSSVSELSDILWVALNRDVQLPVRMDSLGVFAYSGTLKGNLSDMISRGNLSSNLGDIQVSVSMSSPDLMLNTYLIDGSIQSDNCHLDRAFGTSSELGNFAFNLDIHLKKYSDRNFKIDAVGNIDSLYYKDYCYQNINMNGSFDKNGFDGKLIMSDRNAEFSFLGKMDLKREKPLFHFVANVDKFNLTNTNIMPTSKDAQLTFSVETNFEGNNLDDLEGSFSMDNVVFIQDDKEVNLNNISVSAITQKQGNKKLSVFSDYLNGSLIGRYSFSNLPLFFHNLAHRYFPVFVKDEKEVKSSIDKHNDFTFDFSIENLEPIHEIYPMPLVVVEEARLKGSFNDQTQKFRCRLETPRLKKGQAYLTDCLFLVENLNDDLKVKVRTTYHPKNTVRHPYYVSLTTLTQKDNLDLDFSFSNTEEVTYSGKLGINANFKDYSKEGLTADFFVKPSKIVLNDTIWNIHKSDIQISPSSFKVDSFLFNHGTQFLSVDGLNSVGSNDSVCAHFSDLYLGYISDILANSDITFNGVTDGDVFLYNLFDKPYFKGNLYVYDGTINECVLGDMAINSKWIEKNKCIDFNVDLLSLYQDRQELSKSVIHGGVFLENDSLYIGGDLNNVDMRFLRKYLKNVMANNTGTVSGKVKAFGKFGDIGLEGMAYVKDMAFDIDYLKTSYVLSDSVKLTKHTIELNQTQIFDTEGNYGIASGMLLHDAFRNIKFAFNIQSDNLLMLNTKEEDNETFFGKAYTLCDANISGTPDIINMNIYLKTNSNTMMTIPLEGVSSAKEGSFVTFVESEEKQTMAEKRRLRREKLKQIAQKNNSSSVINVTIDLDATPDAQVHLIMDPQQGDVIRANGLGALRLTYNSADNLFKMYGGYEINKGDYLFTIQSVISRKFDIETGSTVRWTGNPYNADIDIIAKYSLNAPLSDIVEDPIEGTSNNALVNCYLKLNGTISSPTIKFDIDLPNSDEDVKSNVRSVINTEEAMNRNIASLLALGHFYNIEQDATTMATNELSSVGFSTLSSQLTNWISKINKDVNIGLNYRPNTSTEEGVKSSEFDVALSTQLFNDRLLVNGNFGYRDEVTDVDNISNSIVDFDIEYKLNKTGKLRTKAFNRSNNSYFKQSPNTQGIGIVYREDFDTFTGLLKNYWNALKRKKDKEENSKETPNKEK